jgi:glycosyltransferase involved in cell wall biosynthesis
LVHHLRLKPVMYGSIAARLAGVPAVINLLTGLGHLFTGNSPKARVLRNVVEQGCKVGFGHRNQRVIFQNPDDQDLFVSRRIADTQDCRLIRGSGVDISLFRPQPEVPGTPIVVLPARMLWDKGIGEYVVAARLLRDKGAAARLVLVGGSDRGNPTAIPVEQLQQWNGSGVVEWWGHQTDMQSVFAKSHIVCLPSYREGVPKALLEAAATGRTIVATDVPGCREVVRHGENGLLVPPHQPAPLAAALGYLIRDSAARLRMGRASRALAVSDFSLGRIISETLAVYDEVCPAPKSMIHYASAL